MSASFEGDDFVGKTWEVQHTNNTVTTIEAEVIYFSPRGAVWFYNKIGPSEKKIVYVISPTGYISIRPIEILSEGEERASKGKSRPKRRHKGAMTA